jgi:branched-subunit amino acid ABC-type transport system permease component
MPLVSGSAAIVVTAGAGWLLDRFIFAPLRARRLIWRR